MKESEIQLNNNIRIGQIRKFVNSGNNSLYGFYIIGAPQQDGYITFWLRTNKLKVTIGEPEHVLAEEIIVDQVICG